VTKTLAGSRIRKWSQNRTRTGTGSRIRTRSLSVVYQHWVDRLATESTQLRKGYPNSDPRSPDYRGERSSADRSSKPADVAGLIDQVMATQQGWPRMPTRAEYETAERAIELSDEWKRAAGAEHSLRARSRPGAGFWATKRQALEREFREALGKWEKARRD
jgi:hypothetical protein